MLCTKPLICSSFAGALPIESKWAREQEEKRKSGPKHKAKSSATSSQGQSLSASEDEPEVEGGSSDQSDLDEFDTSELETERTLRTQTLMEATDFENVGDFGDSGADGESEMEIDQNLSTEFGRVSQNDDAKISTGDG